MISVSKNDVIQVSGGEEATIEAAAHSLISMYNDENNDVIMLRIHLRISP